MTGFDPIAIAGFTRQGSYGWPCCDDCGAFVPEPVQQRHLDWHADPGR